MFESHTHFNLAVLCIPTEPMHSSVLRIWKVCRHFTKLTWAQKHLSKTSLLYLRLFQGAHLLTNICNFSIRSCGRYVITSWNHSYNSHPSPQKRAISTLQRCWLDIYCPISFNLHIPRTIFQHYFPPPPPKRTWMWKSHEQNTSISVCMCTDKILHSLFTVHTFINILSLKKKRKKKETRWQLCLWHFSDVQCARKHFSPRHTKNTALHTLASFSSIH